MPQYSFVRAAGEVYLSLNPAKEPSTKFLLEVPDYHGPQTARLPLPECLISENTFETIFTAAIGKFIDRAGKPLEPGKASPFPDFPVKVPNPLAPGQAAIWVRHVG